MQTTYRRYKRSDKTNHIKYLSAPSKGQAIGFASSFFSFVFFLLPSLLEGSGMSLLSQIIDPSPTPVSISDAHFNRAFIRRNKIKTITARVVDKPDGEIIRDKGLAQVYAFDTSGNLTRHYFNEITSLEKTETEIPAVYRKGRVVKKAFTKIDFQYQYDTLGTEYFYTNTGFLIMKRVCIGDFFHSTYFEYFDDGMVSRQTLCKETNIAKPGEPFKLGVQTVLSDEKFEYEQMTPTQVKKKFFNDEGKPYKQGILNFSNGKPVEESYQFVVGFIRSSVNYTYDKQDRLIEKRIADNSSGTTTSKVVYEYDDNGNVKSEKKFKNGIQIDEIVYLYGPPVITSRFAGKEGAVFLTSQIDRQLQKASIRILKYEYTFY